MGPAEPEVTVNPYFKPNNEPNVEAQPNQQTVSTPQLISNPYFVKKLDRADSKRLASSDAELR